MPKTCSKTFFKRPLKEKTKIGFQDRLSLNAGQRYCRMLQGEHSAILSTSIKLPFVIKIFVLSILSGHLRQVLLYMVQKKKKRFVITLIVWRPGRTSSLPGMSNSCNDSLDRHLIQLSNY